MQIIVLFRMLLLPVAILAADGKRSFCVAWTVMKDCRSQLAWQCSPRAERERDRSGYRASGLTSELPVHVVLVPPLLVPPPSLGVLPGYEKVMNLTRAGHRIVQSTLLLSYCLQHQRHAGADVYPTDTSQ